MATSIIALPIFAFEPSSVSIDLWTLCECQPSTAREQWDDLEPDDHPTSDQELQAWLRDTVFDCWENEEAKRQWVRSNGLDKEAYESGSPQELPEWLNPADLVAGGGIPCAEAFRNMGKIWTSDGTEVWRHEDPERFNRLVRRIHDIGANGNEFMCTVHLPCNPFVCIHYGQVIDGYMVVATEQCIREVELYGQSGEGLGVYALEEYAYLTVLCKVS